MLLKDIKQIFGGGSKITKIIHTKDTVGEPFVGTTDVEDYVFEDSKPTLMYVDFINLNGEVYDQYAELMEVSIVFSIDSEVASI